MESPIRATLWRLPPLGALPTPPPGERPRSSRSRVKSRLSQRLLQADAYRAFYAQFNNTDDGDEHTNREEAYVVHPSVFDTTRPLSRTTRTSTASSLSSIFLRKGVHSAESCASLSSLGAPHSDDWWRQCLHDARQQLSLAENSLEKLEILREQHTAVPTTPLQRKVLGLRALASMTSTNNSQTPYGTTISGPWSGDVVVRTPAGMSTWAATEHLRRVRTELFTTQKVEEQIAENAERVLMTYEERRSKLIASIRYAQATQDDLQEFAVFVNLYGRLSDVVLHGSHTQVWVNKRPGRRYRRIVLRSILHMQDWWWIHIPDRRTKKWNAAKVIQRSYRGFTGRIVYLLQVDRVNRVNTFMAQLMQGQTHKVFSSWGVWAKRMGSSRKLRKRVHIREMSAKLRHWRMNVALELSQKSARLELYLARKAVRTRAKVLDAWRVRVEIEEVAREYKRLHWLRVVMRLFNVMREFVNACKAARHTVAIQTANNAIVQSSRTVAGREAKRRKVELLATLAEQARAAREARQAFAPAYSVHIWDLFFVPNAIQSASAIITQRRREEDSARKVQRIWRSKEVKRMARTELLENIGMTYAKRWDKEFQAYYYIERATGTENWDKPAMLVVMQRWMGGYEIVDISTPRTRMKGRGALMRLNLHEIGVREHGAAKKIQCMVRNKRARKLMKVMCAMVYEHAWDPETGKQYWMNKRTGESKWDAPALIREDFVIDPKRPLKGLANRKKQRMGRGIQQQGMAGIMSMSGMNMPMAGMNMSMAGMNMSMAGMNMSMAGMNMPMAGMNVPTNMSGMMPMAGMMPTSAMNFSGMNMGQPNMMQANMMQANMIQANMMQPNLLQPNMLQPNLLQPNMLQPNIQMPQGMAQQGKIPGRYIPTNMQNPQ